MHRRVRIRAMEGVGEWGFEGGGVTALVGGGAHL